VCSSDQIYYVENFLFGIFELTKYRPTTIIMTYISLFLWFQKCLSEFLIGILMHAFYK